MKRTKNFFFAGLAIAALAAGGFAQSNAKANRSQLSAVQLETIEALTRGESVSNLSCSGWMGYCSYNCTSCGFRYSAIGSQVSGSHSCN